MCSPCQTRACQHDVQKGLRSMVCDELGQLITIVQGAALPDLLPELVPTVSLCVASKVASAVPRAQGRR